mgnify:CR=1 FL=1
MQADFIEGTKSLIRIISILAGIGVYISLWRLVVKSWGRVWGDTYYDTFKYLILVWIFLNIGVAIAAFRWAWT